MLKIEIPVNEKGDAFEFDLDRKIISIGRRHDNDIRILEDSVSAYHAEFIREDEGQLIIADRGSFNGTWLNGRKVEGHAEVADGDTIFFGQLRCVIVNSSPGYGSSFGPISNEGLSSGGLATQTQPSVKTGDRWATQSSSVHGVPESVFKKEKPTIPLNELGSMDDHSALYEVKSTGEGLIGKPSDIAPLPSTNRAPKVNSTGMVSFAQQLDEMHRIDQLALEKMILEDETIELRKERERLNRDIESAFQKLDDSEDKLCHLKFLEKEMQVSLERSGKSKFNRKGMYYEAASNHSSETETEISICRELIGWLQLLDDLLGHYQQKWGTQKVASHLVDLRDRFMYLLSGYSVEPFSVKTGERITAELRSKILLIPIEDLEDPKIKRLALKIASTDGKRIVKTVRDGFVYRNQSGDVVLRKADVVVV